jgi:1-acyl-sn-glycerol-3-phosphate acyltransferase
MVVMSTVSPAYRFVMALSTPAVKWWGRLDVSGLEQLPAEGPVLLAANHDSYWDPIAIGIAGLPRRQIRALAKSTLGKVKGLRRVLDGMGQIPIERGKGDQGAMQRAIDELRAGSCIGVFPEGTRSLGRELPARSGFGRLAEAVPEAVIVCCTVAGTVDIPKFPKARPNVTARFFRPAGGGLQPGESHREFGARLLAELRAAAPVAQAGRRRPVQPKAKTAA